MLSFAVYRMGDGGRVLAGEHGVWLDAGPWVKVKAGEVRIECLGASIDVDRLVRKHVLRYRIGERGVERIDPVALRPQDFSEEWLSRPWAEVASRSDPASLETLERWHRRLHADFVSGEFDFVQRCSAKTDEWQMGLDLNTTGKPPWRGYLLVRELGDERFEMVDVSSRRQAGCPGESPPGGPGDEK
ncbi:MAG: hypothetical protein NTY38_25720 [Acidobacteria bacterium]|nr:hypothetical protein [Acidobacteriota bacterium]